MWKGWPLLCSPPLVLWGAVVRRVLVVPCSALFLGLRGAVSRLATTASSFLKTVGSGSATPCCASLDFYWQGMVSGVLVPACVTACSQKNWKRVRSWASIFLSRRGWEGEY